MNNATSNGILDKPENSRIKTLVHEIGNALGLGHPEETNCKSYKSIMRQGIVSSTANSLVSGTITTHDMYNLTSLYK